MIPPAMMTTGAIEGRGSVLIAMIGLEMATAKARGGDITLALSKATIPILTPSDRLPGIGEEENIMAGTRIVFVTEVAADP